MKAQDFPPPPLLRFLGGENSERPLYFHYAARKNQDALSVPEYILETLQIPPAGINLKTGRIETIDSLSHKKYFDSKANCRAFLNTYLQHFPLESLMVKEAMLHNAKKPGSTKRPLFPGRPYEAKRIPGFSL